MSGLTGGGLQDAAAPGWPARGGPQDLFYARGTTDEFPRIVRGEGVHLWDDAGNRYLDVASGAFLSNIGQGNDRVLRAMYEQGRRFTYSFVRNTRHEANIALSDRLVRFAGPGFDRVHLSSGGSEAIEAAIMILRQHAVATGQPRRHRVITLMPSYHGGTLATIGMTGDRAAEIYGPMTVFSEKVPAPLTCRSPSPEAAARSSIQALEETIQRVGSETVLALLCEPVGGQASGANVPHPWFFERARQICTEHGIHLVFDEVVSAFRTGRFLAAHHQPAAMPDVVVLAKGLGAGYAPLGALLTPARIADELADRSGFHVAHSADANPIACAAGSAVLDEIEDRGLLERAGTAGAPLRAGLERLAARSPLVGEVRGLGLLLAIELVADKRTMRPFGADVDPADRLRHHAARHGLLVYSRRQNAGEFGDWLLITPPLVITDDEVDELVDRLGRAVDDATEDLLG
ncbi:MAG: aminotransferase class III-fold pyridoxal phosphate-dependent enzyme [Actinomycetota bacterium]